MELFATSSPAQSSIEYPQQLTEKYRPRVPAEFIGLDRVKAIFASLVACPKPSAWLLTGPSGTGKTSITLGLANAMPAELHHIPSQECNLESLERVRRTCQYMPQAGTRAHLVLIDEMNEMSPAAQNKMLSLTDSTNFPPNTIFLATSNSVDRLSVALKSRFHILECSSYGLSKDTAALLERVWQSEKGTLDNAPNFARIVKESNNNVRESLINLEVELMIG